jgi:hypothetical protein
MYYNKMNLNTSWYLFFLYFHYCNERLIRLFEFHKYRKIAMTKMFRL